jgi:hypothetical protein
MDTKMNELYEKMLPEIAKTISHNSKEKQQLIEIILEKSDDKTKLNKIRRLLLEFKQKVQQNIEKNKEGGELALSVIGNAIPKMSINELNSFTKMMNVVCEPDYTHQKMLESIGDVMRSDLVDDKKIEKITDILL